MHSLRRRIKRLEAAANVDGPEPIRWLVVYAGDGLREVYEWTHNPHTSTQLVHDGKPLPILFTPEYQGEEYDEYRAMGGINFMIGHTIDTC